MELLQLTHKKPLSSSTPEPQNSSFGNDSTLSQEALSSDSTTTLQVSNERSFSSEPRSSTPKLGSTFKEPHNPANNEVTVDELAKSISAEFASLEFSQPIAKVQRLLTLHQLLKLQQI